MAIQRTIEAVVQQMGKVRQNVAQAMMTDRAALEKLAYDATSNLTLVGPPGTGKSSLARTIAAGHGLETYPYQCSDQASGASLFQLMGVEADGSMSVWKGPGLTAFQDGGMLIVEEINEASQDLLGVLTMLMVRGLGATVRTMRNELIELLDTYPIDDKHPLYQEDRAGKVRYRVIATMNGDPHELPERILDRAPAVPISCPSAAMLRTLPPDLARLTTRAYAAVHETGLIEGLPFTFRQMQHLAEFRQIAPLPTAALVAFNGNREMAALFCDTLLPLVAAPSGSRQGSAA